MKRLPIQTAAMLTLVCLATGCSQLQKGPTVVLLPDQCNTPDGTTLSPDGQIILSVPNFNNGALIEAGTIKEPAPAHMMRIDKNNQISTWYTFKPKDLHPTTKLVGPMGCDFGPDGNLYVADNQIFQDGNNQSRLLKINVRNGKAVSCEVVVEGFIVSNAVIWRGDTVYVSETILQHPAKVEEGQPKPPLISGVYAIKMSEWKDGPVKLKPWAPDDADPHLIATYKTSNRVGFGADGLTFDGEGNLYCSIFEDGFIYKTTFKKNGKPKETKLFAKHPSMASADGIFWRQADNTIYVADMLNNAVQAVDMKGNVTTVHRNGDTDGADGSLDQPCEVIVRGDKLIAVNMDMWWECEYLTNTKLDSPYTLSVIGLPK